MIMHKLERFEKGKRYRFSRKKFLEDPNVIECGEDDSITWIMEQFSGEMITSFDDTRDDLGYIIIFPIHISWCEEVGEGDKI